MTAKPSVPIFILIWMIGSAASDHQFISTNTYLPGDFVSGIFDKIVRLVGSQRCKLQLATFKHDVNNFTLWAMQMLDSSAKMPSGVLVGSSYHLGNFDECLAVTNGLQGTDQIRGKYCLTSIELEPNTKMIECTQEHSSQCIGWDKLQVPKSRMKVRRNRLRVALCIPSGCSAKDLEQGLQFLENEFSSLTIRTKVDEKMCQTQDIESKVSLNNFWIAMLLYVLFLSICEMRISMNNDASKSDKSSEWYSIFSVRTHWHNLTSVERSSNSITCIDGLRVLCMMLIVVGHRGEAVTAGPLVSTISIEEMYDDFLGILVMNGHFVVDVFFVISGFLICWKLLHYFEMEDRPALIWVNLYRYSRLIPVLAVIIFIEANILYDLSNGPLWPEKIGPERANCRNNWWTNFIFVNNYIRPESPCVDPSWYIACDTQLFLIAPVVVHLIKKWRKYDYFILTSFIFISALIPFIVTYIGDLDPTIIADPSMLGHATQNKTYIQVYVTSYCRAGPYFVGMLFAYWLYKLQTNNSQMSQGVVWAGWVLGPMLQIAVGIATYICYDEIKLLQMNKLLIASIAGWHRILFSLGIGFYITACANGKGGFINSILSWDKFVPFSRLTYSLFLCHTVVQMFHFGSVRTQLHMSVVDDIWFSSGDLVLSVLIATVLYLTVERPAIAFVLFVIQRIHRVQKKKSCDELLKNGVPSREICNNSSTSMNSKELKIKNKHE